MNPQKNICIYCASSSDIDRRYFDEATRLAKLIAGKGMGIVCGAGNQGLMGAVAELTYVHSRTAAYVLFPVERNNSIRAVLQFIFDIEVFFHADR